MTSHRQCGTAKGRAADCRHQGTRRGGSWPQPPGDTGCQLNGSEISASWRGAGSPKGSWPPTSGSCREDSMAIPCATAFHLWVHNKRIYLVGFLKCLWMTAGAKAVRDVSALLRWPRALIELQLWSPLGLLKPRQGSPSQLPALPCSNRGMTLEQIRAFWHTVHG